MAKYASKHDDRSRGDRSKDRLSRLGVKPSKQRGQNFLIDPSVLSQIVSFGHPERGDRIVEVGPGLGALTELLVGFGPITAIEIERQFCEDLRARFAGLEVIEHDIRTFDLGTLGSELVVFGNLPYIYSTDIIFHLVKHAGSVKRAVLLLQREFAERLAAAPGGRDYGSITVACRLWADVELGPIIPGTSFHPPTKVESRLVELKFLRAPRVDVGDAKWFERVVRSAFRQRRKKLSNSLASSGHFSKLAVAEALSASGIDGGRRAETLSLDEFVTLARELKSL